MEPSGSSQPNRWWPKLQIPLIAAIIVVAGGLVLWLLARRGEEKSREWEAAASAELAASQAPPPATSASASPLGDLTKIDVSDLYPRIRQRAEQWSPNPRLISIAAGPVVGSKVDLTATDGEIVYQFAARLEAMGHEQPPGRLALHVTRQGIKAAPGIEPEKARPAKAARDPLPQAVPSDPGEPNCVSDAAAKAARASGIPAATPMKLRYEVDPILRRGVWLAKVEGKRELDRVIDGKTCAVVVRR
jgi:hypothetical protein